jgi:hypothetical protein
MHQLCVDCLPSAGELWNSAVARAGRLVTATGTDSPYERGQIGEQVTASAEAPLWNSVAYQWGTEHCSRAFSRDSNIAEPSFPDGGLTFS